MDGNIYIISLHQGDQVNFREVFDTYHTRLCYFAATLLADGQGAEDAVQEAFAKLWQKRNDFATMGAVKAFLYISVKNSCLNIHKHSRVVKKHGDLLQQKDIENDGADKLDHIIEAEVLESVYQALQKLPEGCRHVLQLSYFEGMKNPAIARQLQVSVNTVKTQKKRGLHLLRLMLKGSSLVLLLLDHLLR